MADIETIRAWQDEFDAIRRDFHAHPELGLEEHRTSEIVARKLAEWGIEVHRGVGVTGAVGVLKKGSGGLRIVARAYKSEATRPAACSVPGE